MPLRIILVEIGFDDADRLNEPDGLVREALSIRPLVIFPAAAPEGNPDDLAVIVPYAAAGAGSVDDPVELPPLFPDAPLCSGEPVWSDGFPCGESEFFLSIPPSS